jgi:flagellar hook-length control protein FliK
VQGVSSCTGSATEDSDEAGQAVEALKEDGAESGETAFQNSDEETAQLSELKDALRTVASAEPQASVAVAKSSPQTAAERSAQPADGQAQKSRTGIAATATGDVLQSTATAASTRNAALGGQFAASMAKTLGHGAGGTTQSNASQSDTTQSSAHKWNAHENSNAQQTATTSSNTHAAQATDGAAKAEKVREGSSDTMPGNTASTAATANAAVTVKAEASTPVQPVTAMASAAMSAAMTATSTTGTTPTRPTMPASAETQAATVATSQNSTLDTAHLRTTAGSTELKVSVQLPDLGRVEVRAVTNASGTEAHLTTEHHAAAAALNSGRDGLEAALRTHDVTLGSLTTQSQAQGGHEHNQPESQRASGTNNNARDTDGRLTNSEAESETTTLPEYSSISVLV